MAGAANEVLIVVKSKDQTKAGFKSAEDGANRVSGRMSMMGAVVAGAVGGAAVGGVLALGKAMVNGFKDADSYQKLQRQTATVLKSTGNVAGTSVGHVRDLASQLETMSGVDEALIINSQNVLATFTGIRNVGKDKIFDQATKSALDMSTALGTDLQGASIQIGKALNDPIKGITALSRVGVSFTKQQKDQIATMVKHGDTLGAQKLILGELNKEFGGAAKTAGTGFSGAMARVKDALGDAFRQLATSLLPALTRFAEWMSSKGIPGAINLAKAIGAKIIPVLKTMGSWIASHLPLLKYLAIAIGTALVAAFIAWAVSAAAAAVATIAATWPILAIIAAIGLLVAGLVYAYKHWGWFRTAVNAAAGVLKGMFNWVKSHWRLILALLTGPIGLAVMFIVSHFGQILSFAKSLPGKIGSAFKAVYHFLIDPIADAVTWAINRLGDLLDFVKRIPGKVGGALKGMIPGMAHGGIVGAAATGGPRGRLTMVGEHGAELLNLPPGTTVHSNPDTQRMLSGGGGGGGSLQIEWVGGSAGDEFISWLRKNIRIRGGDVQSVLGRA